jgi:transposase InsO family protein
MKDAIFLMFELLVAIARLLGPGGSRAIIAENLLLKQQLLVHSRARQRAPNLSVMDRTLFGFWTLFLSPRRIARSAILIKPSTLLRFHTALKRRKYRSLYSPRSGRKPGPKGLGKEVITAIVGMKRRNPRFGCPRIAQQINLAFGLELNKDIVRRILAIHYRPDHSSKGPSWLAMLGHAKDSLWSVDLFRCESILLKSHWVMVVMDIYTRRIIGFGLHDGHVDGPTLCRMFIDATSGQSWPKYLSSDNDPLFQHHRWKANLRILEVEEIKSIPHVPMSHPFVERLIGSIRRELLDHTFFWTVTDLENKLHNYQCYYNQYRTHSGRDGATPVVSAGNKFFDINQYRWKKHCRGLFELPVAA